jgi:hydroxymethylpyrimidine/phosphomethylpyrimidine kinase
MVSTSGHRLLSVEAESVVRELLVPLAALVTPNLDEAEILTGRAARDVAGMERAGRALLDEGASAALIKGGHLEGDELTDILMTPEGMIHFRRPRIETTSTHGTGCTLSAAITAGLALGRNLEIAVADALDYVHRAMREAPGLGSGHGPLDHRVTAPPPPPI